MKLSEPKSAEANFREAFERLKLGDPKTLPRGTPISQNNVAKEAGCDPSALRKSRFPTLVAEIQSYLANQTVERAPSDRQRLLKQRQRHRNAQTTIDDLRAQRDSTVSLLMDANAQISLLTRKLRDTETRLHDLQSKNISIFQPPFTPKARPGPMDTTDHL